MSNVTCYNPDQSKPGNTGPCTAFPDADGESACCAYNDLCVSNGFCLGTSNAVFYRGACTKRTWDSNACPTVCGQQLRPAVVPCSTEVWACGYASDATAICANASLSDTTFRVSQDSPLAFQVLGIEVANAAGSSTESFGAVTIYDSMASTATSGRVIKTITTTAAARSASGSAASDAAASSNHDTVIAVGAALGVLCALALIAAGWLAILLRKAKKRLIEERERKEMPPEPEVPVAPRSGGRHEMESRRPLIELSSVGETRRI